MTAQSHAFLDGDDAPGVKGLTSSVGRPTTLCDGQYPAKKCRAACGQVRVYCWAAAMTPEQRSQRARIGGLMLHAQQNSNEIAARARTGFDKRFEREADPDGTLPEAERARRVALLRRAYFVRLALQSSMARQAVLKPVAKP
jgi:hypothetical protein